MRIHPEFSNVHFADKVTGLACTKRSFVLVGLDTDPERLPQVLQPAGKPSSRSFEKSLAKAQMAFNKTIIDAIADIAVGVKLQIAFYEELTSDGIRAYIDTIKYAKERGLIVIGDIKRGDIGNTAIAYAKAHLEMANTADAVTVNPYMGSDAVLPFVESANKHNKGIFVLVRTSNPSSKEFQDLIVKTDNREQALYEVVASHVHNWGKDFRGKCGYSLVGAVVGATFPEEGRKLRARMPSTLFLVPGYGAQGASAHDVSMCFDEKGGGAIVNASRSIIYAFEKAKEGGSLKGIGQCAREAAEKMRNEINDAVEKRK